MSHGRRLLKIAAALGLLAVLYWHCDARRVGDALAGLNPFWLTLTLLLFVPQILVSAWRWQILATPLARISLLEAVRQTLASSAWNLAIPSKLGDFSKAGMLPIDRKGQRTVAAGLVALEKAADVAALLLLWLWGAALSQGSAWLMAASILLPAMAIAAAWWLSRYLVLGTQYSALGTQYSVLSTQFSAALSLFLWLLHLAQIHLMLLAAGVNLSFGLSIARIPAAIFAGLLPLSLCGIGTRDGALIWLFSDVAPAGTMAAVGLLTATRYLVPGAAGIPFIWKRQKRGVAATALKTELPTQANSTYFFRKRSTAS